MITFLILTFALIHLTLLITTFVWENKTVTSHELNNSIQLSNVFRLWFLRALLMGMLYDNLTVALGYWFIDESWYKVANYPRFYIHVIILPFLTLFTFSLLKHLSIVDVRKENSRFLTNKTFQIFCIAFTFSMLIFGINHELIGLQLAPKEALDFTRYSKVISSPPIATILTNLFTIALSIVLWRKIKWKILTIGSSIIFIINAASAGQPWGFLAGNVSEIVFVLSLMLTHRHFLTLSFPSQAASLVKE